HACAQVGRLDRADLVRHGPRTMTSTSKPPDMPIAAQLVFLAELAAVDAKHKIISDKLESVPAGAKKADEAANALQKQHDDVVVKREAAEKAKKLIEA